MMQQSEMYSVGYMLKNIFVMQYSPKIRRLHVKKCRTSSFLYVVRGRYHYTSDFIDFYVSSGQAVYLPQNAQYIYQIVSEETECIQVEFELKTDKNVADTNCILFEHPIVLCTHENIIKSVFNDFVSTYHQDEFSVIASVYRLISFLKNNLHEHKTEGGDLRKIEPAIKYIEQNFYNKIYVSYLAELCGISQSHLRRLFVRHLGMSPIKYKNSLLMQTACNMLRREQLNVSETSEALHFNDIYTFSQLFKREVGISPKKYADEPD